MSGTRAALLIGCSHYQEPDLQQLSASQDVEALTGVLVDPAIGNFIVYALSNEESGKVREQIDAFFRNRMPDDLLLLYFSCHGIRDPSGLLHFVAADTKKESLHATAISGLWVKERMNESSSRRIVLLLDCCYGGAFGKGLTRRGVGANEILDQLGGDGRVVITASGSMEYAYESEFTDAVVRGLETGAADLDGDGWVSADELYQYVYDQVRQRARGQTPTMSADGMRGKLLLAKNAGKPLPLPAEFEQVLTSEIAWKRLWAIDGLQRLLAGGNSGGQKLSARKALDRLSRDDTDSDVRKAASEASSRVSQEPEVADLPLQGDPKLDRVHRVRAAVLAAVLSLAPPLMIHILAPNLFACSPTVRSADALSLGTLFPTDNGGFFDVGPALKAGVDLAWDDIQANIKGHGPISDNLILTLDGAKRVDEGNPSSSPETAKTSTDFLLTGGGVDVIIGPSTSQVAKAVVDKVVCAGVIMFAPSNTARFLTDYNDHGLYFRTAPLSSLEGFVLGRRVVADGNSTAVVIWRDDPYGESLREDTEKAINESGGKVVDSFSYDPSAPDRVDIQRIKAKESKAIVLIGFPEEGTKILKKMVNEGIAPRGKKVKVYGSGAIMTNTLAGKVDGRDRGALEGMRGTPLDSGGKDFVDRLKKVNPGLLDVTYAAQAYDAVVITVLAAAVVGSAPSDIAREINDVTKSGDKCKSFNDCMVRVKAGRDIDYDGPSGSLDFTEAGEPSSGSYMISEFKADGTIKTCRIETVGFQADGSIQTLSSTMIEQC